MMYIPQDAQDQINEKVKELKMEATNEKRL